MKRGATAPVGFAIILVMILGITAVEIHHRLRFGHFVGYGIHADLVESPGDIGVPGIKTLYAAKVSNYTFLPLKLVGWVQTSDFLGAPRVFSCRFQVQKLSPQDGHWIVVMDFKPTGGSQFPVATKMLYPLDSVVPMDHLPAGAVDSLRIGDVARFAVFTNLSASVANVYTQLFRIKEVRTAGNSPAHTGP
jgi:hypothetical protein